VKLVTQVLRSWALVLAFGVGVWNCNVSAAEAAEAPRIFVCGHSFHIFTARLLPELAQAAGIKYGNAGQQMIGGSRTLQHWNLPDDQNKAKAALKAGEVDVLTLSPHLLIPDEGIDNFTKLGLEKNPKLRVLVQASWMPRDAITNGAKFSNAMRDDAKADDLKRIRAAQDDWRKLIETQVKKLNASVGRETVHIVPVGDAVIDLRQRILDGKAPGLTKQTDLFRDDLGHPQPALAQLVVYCQFVSVYQRSPVGLPVPTALKGLPQAEELNRVLQQIAWDVVSGYPMSGVKAKVAKQ
jgi:hypothetical protein